MAKKVFVIAGAAGTGKTTLANYLQTTYHMARVITHTTRPPRTGEQDGVDYYFETESSIQQRHLLEKVEYDHHLYGSSLEGLQRGWANHPADVIVLDTQGAITYQQKLGNQVVVIFLTISKPEELANRLRLRGDDPQAIASRLQSQEYRRDLNLPRALASRAHVIVNDDWTSTTQAVDRLVEHYI